MTDLPFQAEYAKSSKAKCKGCKQIIVKDSLRLGIMVQSAFFDGKQANWHHEDCFFKKARVQCASEVAFLNTLKIEDKDRIKKRIESSTDIVLAEEKGKKKKRAAEPTANAALKDYKVEYSKSSRAACKHCDIKICKDEVRICKTMFDTEVAKKYGGQAYWYHVKCFVAVRDNLGYFAGGEDLPGFEQLKNDDQKMIKSEIPAKSPEAVPAKKTKTVDKELEEKLKTQDELFNKHRDALMSLSPSCQNKILYENSQFVDYILNAQHSGSSPEKFRDHLADMMTFGALERCPECNGQLVLDTFNYKCTGDLSEWTKCQYANREPKRKPMILAEQYKEHDAFKDFVPAVGIRLFEYAAPPSQNIDKNEKSEEKKNVPIPPLKNLQFYIFDTHGPKVEVKNRILRLGGLVLSKTPTDTAAAVIATKAGLAKMEKNLTIYNKIRDWDVEVVEDTFLDSIDPVSGTIEKTLELIKEHNIAPWGSDPAKRLPQDIVDGKSILKSGSLYVKSKPTLTKVKVKGGMLVDPDSGVADEAHVYKGPSPEHCDKHSVVLSKTDVTTQTNSYFKLQLLESDVGNKYWVFRSWGRIGTKVGGKKLEGCRDVFDARKKFYRYYQQKTKNDWGNPQFVKKPDAYFPVEMDYGEGGDDGEVLMTEDEHDDLPLAVQRLVMRIFDVRVMKQTLCEFELDTEKMPLGKLSKNQINNAYKVLSELLEYIKKGNSSESKIIDATNRFFTMVPHDFGQANAPLLNSIEAITQKTAMLDNLLEIEIAYNLLKSDDEENNISPLKSRYLKLKAELTPLDPTSEEYQMIALYTANTHAATHSNYTLEIEQVFKVVREGEDKRYKPFRKLHNRRLLWHGSRVTNFAGILSQGLRIAPPEAPVTGYMFGKGVYFADMVSKSANYCCAYKNNPVGIMLLCEVALGDMKQCTDSEFITKLPEGLHSTWGVGRTQPDPASARTLPDGTLVPLGKPVTDDSNNRLLYNEFIVYDVSQINVKYLLQMKFNYL